MLYRRKLEQKFPSCDVVEAASCIEALHTLARLAPDVIIANQAAVDARGVEMVRAIRRADSSIPLVSVGEVAQEQDLLRNGADVFLPADDWENVAAAVQQALVRRR